jgi:uncharacterized protein (TIRG00374 family)
MVLDRVSSLLSRQSVRIGAGLLISVIFIALTLSRVDVEQLGAAARRVQPGILIAAVLFVGLETSLRAKRWHILLQPIQPIPYRSALAYLCIGYLANAVLPARLGDLTRAYLAGGALGMGRLGVLGTIVVERLTDGFFILIAVVALSVLVVGGGSVAGTAAGLTALAVLGVVGAVGVLLVARRAGVQRTRVGAIVASLLERLAVGTAALREPRGLAAMAGLTVAAFGIGVVTFSIVARATGVELTLAQAALATGAVGLSLAIPAAPASLGTFEFVGTTVLASFGASPEAGLITTFLVHLLSTVTNSLAGLVAAWALHFRVREVTDAARPAGELSSGRDAS